MNIPELAATDASGAQFTATSDEPINNSSDRHLDVFFYGLYQDTKFLTGRGGAARNVRLAEVHGYRLRLGNRGSLLRDPSARAWGIVCALTHAEIESLYAGVELRDYRPEPLTVQLQDGRRISALCYVTVTPPADSESNPDYAQKLAKVMHAWGFPTNHLEESAAAKLHG